MPEILGARLRKEREGIGITQDTLAKGIGLSSEFISLLELGKRMPSLETLTTIADYFKKDISYFLKEREEAFKILLEAERLDKKAKAQLKKFKIFCEEYISLEKLTGQWIELAPHYTSLSAERMAAEERRRIGLGTEPIKDIHSLVEQNGLRIIRQSFPETSNIAGIFIFFEAERAAFALINSSQSPGRQALSAAHEYGHYLRDRYAGPIIDNPDIFIDEYLSLYHPRERFAQMFAVRFLMPPLKVKEIIDRDFRSNLGRFEDVLYLKRYFGVSTLAMLQTLKDLNYLSRSKFDEYRKLDSESLEESLYGKLPVVKLRKGRIVLSDRFKRLAISSYKKKKITAERISNLFHMDKDKILSVIRKSK